MRKNILLLFFLICIVHSFGQGKILPGLRLTGKVVDSVTRSPLEYATISLFKIDDSKAETGTTTDRSGRFEISDIPSGNYSIIIEFIGYQPKTINLDLSNKNGSADLKQILLSKSVSTMQGIVVTARGHMVENKIDKMVFNAERDLTAQSGVATDLLKKVPMISVDADGNVQLAGSSSIRFLINGKPSSAFGSSIADVLQAIPASQIKSIEVITNPGAKYDAQGLGGIINIILKSSNAKGTNGNLSLTGGTRSENGSFNFNARKGKIGLNAFISGNLRPYSTTNSDNERLTDDTSDKARIRLIQLGSGRFHRNGLQTGFGFDITLDEKNSISGSVSYNHFEYSGSGISKQSLIITRGGINPSTYSEINSINYISNQFIFQNTDASLSYKRTFSKEDQELDVLVTTSLGHNNTNASTEQYMLANDSLYFGARNLNPGRENETNIQVDYTQPMKKNMLLGIGSKAVLYDINSTSDVKNFDEGYRSYLTNSYLSSLLKYHQDVYAFYSELSFPAGTWFDVKFGGRYERTEINAYYSNAPHQVSTPGYNTFVPSLFLTRKIGEDKTIKLNYTKRISRPDYGDLNPFINTSDPKNLTSGNPYLQPEVGHRLELGLNKDFEDKGSVFVSLFYRSNNHDIQPYIVYYSSLKVGDSLYYNVSLSTRQNIGLEKNAGINVNGDLKCNEKFTLRGNAFFFYRHTINALDPGYNSKSFNYRVNLNASYQISPSITSEFFGSFNSPRNEVQGKYPSFTTYSLAIRKQFRNKKTSLAITANNPFNEYLKQRTEVYGANFSTTSIRKIPFRSFGLNFTWKFGKLEFKKDKEENNPSLNSSSPL